MTKETTLLRNAFILMMAFVYSLGGKSQGQFVERFNVLYLDLMHGLPSNFVDDIKADSDGFVWIATYGGGLVRYDGYSILNFGVGSSRSKLKSNSCRNLCEDSFHRLWISFDEYTEVLDLKMLRPVIPHDKRKRLEGILKERSLHVCCDAKGKMWIATMQNIYCVSFLPDGDIDQILRYPYRVNTPDVFINDLDRNGSVWVAFGGTLRRLSVNNEQIVNSAISSALPTLPVAFISDVVKYRDKYWIATNNGLYAYDTYTNELTTYRHDYSSLSLSHDHVSSLAVTPDNQLIIGTLGGIDVPNMEMNRFEHIDVGNDMTLSNNFVNCLSYIYGQLWVGTEGGGVIHFVPRQLQIQNYVHTNEPTSLSPFAVNAMYMQDNGTLWVGTVEGGLNRKIQGETGFTHYTTHNTRLSHNSVSAIVADNRQRLWVGTWAGGINVCSLSSPSDIQPLPIDASYQPLLNFIGALQYDAINDGIWIGSNDGIYFYDIKTGKIRDPFVGNRNFRGCIGSIILPEGKLWMGCLEGAVVVNLKKRTTEGFAYKHLKYQLDEPKSGIIDKIACYCNERQTGRAIPVVQLLSLLVSRLTERLPTGVRNK